MENQEVLEKKCIGLKVKNGVSLKLFALKFQD